MPSRRGSILVLLAAGVWSLTGLAAQAGPPPAGQGGLAPFTSEDELARFLRKAQEQAAIPSTPSAGGDLVLEEVVTTGSRVTPSITNSQHAEVDEGGIVKRHGDHLVILRRGRLFTVDVSGVKPYPVASVNAYAPDEDPSGTWYDEMLVSDDTVVVIGYSYDRRGTEIGIFNINSNGWLKYRATYDFRSYDYYSSRNYASRLIGHKLVLYAPLSLSVRTDDPLDVLPAIRKWSARADAAFKPIITARRIYRAPGSDTPTPNSVLHSVTVCDLARVDLRCQATGVVGDWGRVFYVSPTAMYVWTARNSSDSDSDKSILFRMPLDDSEPRAIETSGNPVDQFSFDETKDGHLNVLVRAESAGDAMWHAEHTGGSVALLRLSLRTMGDGTKPAPASAYHALPSPPDDAPFHNRFVGDYLLYGSGEGWFDKEEHASSVFVVNTKTAQVSQFALTHGVDRLEAMGRDAIVVGENGDDLQFTGVQLTGRAGPAMVQHYTLPNAAQGELRSQGFFYQPDERDHQSGVLALPVRSPAQPGYAHLFEESAAVVFVRNGSAQFHELGQLRAMDERAQDDGCQASCVDWYGNSRPVFIEDRIFALLGYELVEGVVSRDRIHEVHRVSFAPKVLLSQAH